MVPLRSVKRQTLADQICDALTDAMLSGEINMGDRLQTEELAKQFGVSRMPIRQALQKLEEGGFVKANPFSGYRVVSLNADDIRELYVIRGALEPEAARLACRRMTDAEIRATVDAEERLERAVAKQRRDARDISRLNREFHFSIYEASRLPQMVDIISRTWDQLAFCKLSFTQKYVIDAETARHMVHEHQEMLNAVLDRDGELLARILASSISRHGVTVPAAFESHQPAKDVC